MKKLCILFIAIFINLSVFADEFKEGVHYQVLYTEASASPNVTEFFSFYCGHCRQFESVLHELKSRLPEGVDFMQSHVTFLGGDMGIPMTKAFATMELLKLTDTLVPKMFTQIQELEKGPKNETELRQWFIKQGVDANTFDETYNSFIVDSMLNRFTSQFSEAKLRGVPGVVVNNKYVVKTEHLKSYDQYFDLVRYLVDKK